MKVIVVIPTYNERSNVIPLIERCEALFHPPDLFFVDDASPDGTGELLESIRPACPRLRVMHRSAKLGLGSAYREAFRRLLPESYDRYMTMDADLSHRPEYIPALLQASTEADLVIGSRYIRGGACPDWSVTRQLLSRTANRMARGLLGLRSKDCTAGFRCYRRDLIHALDRIGVRSNGYSFQIEMTYYAQYLGFRISEQPIVFEERASAHSKMSYAEVGRAAEALMRLAVQRLGGRGVHTALRAKLTRGQPKDPPVPPFKKTEPRPPHGIEHGGG